MNRDFGQYLDTANKDSLDQDNQTLANLLEEVSQLEDFDPGPLYWAQFNGRLNRKVVAAKKPRRQWLVWGGSTLVAAALLLIFLPVRATVSPEPGFDSLNDQTLALIYEAYYDVEQDDALAFDLGSGTETILDAMDPGLDELGELDLLSEEELLLLSNSWGTEG